ncbi:MAG: hypothetical protein GY847_06120, partial [Proteobacteria bacterium]|nr:hypothetical protein [Pseudomonadota bacterium]
RDTDSVGDYELTVIKAQPKFFGFVTGYSKEGAEQGCGTLDYFDGEGIRLDFIPSGTTENGYLMTVTDEGEGPDTCPGMSGDRDDWGWLVHPYCYGPSGSDEALDYDSWHGGGHHQVWKLLPFKFPLGDKFYPALYFDSTGRIEPREMFGDCVDDGSCAAYDECTEADCECVADLGNQCAYDPGGIDSEPNAEAFFQSYPNGGYAPVIAGAWGSFYEEWYDGTDGYLYAETVVFEGTLAYVITWEGYDFLDDGDSEDLPGYSSWRNFESHISYQVILRADGRIAFYYRGNWDGRDGWDEGVDRNGWIAGISGGLSEIDCSDDGDCTDAYGDEAECDDGDGIDPDYEQSDTCIRMYVPLIGDPAGDGLGNES